jgi:CubicO group peptidase (beta-lactamase class C family)
MFSQEAENSVETKPLVNSFLTEEMKYKIQDYVNYELRSTGIPALTIVIVEGEELRLMHFAQSPGYPSMNGKLINLGTVSRQFTILAAYKLRDESKLNFEDKLNKYLPEVKIGRDQKEETIQLKHLLESTTGLNATSERILHSTNGLLHATTKDLLAHMKDIDYYNAPGTLYVDSNLNYVLLGEVISRVSGLVAEKYILENIIRPIGMERTHYDGIKYLKEGVPIYDYFFSTRRKLQNIESPPSLKTAQRLFVSPEDLAKYISFQLKAMPNDIYHHLTISEMQKPRVYTKKDESIQYGHGWFHKKHGGLKVLYFLSKGNGTSGSIYLLPDKNLGYGVFFNIDATPLNEEMAEGILSILLGVEPKHLSVAHEKILTLISLFLLILSVFTFLAGAFKIDRFFSMLPSEIPKTENLNRNFSIALGTFIFLFWFIFLYFPGSSLGENFTTLPYSSALYGWKTDLLYALLSCLFASFTWSVFFGLTILRETEAPKL